MASESGKSVSVKAGERRRKSGSVSAAAPSNRKISKKNEGEET
jgi:hypothetical protein